MQNGFIAPDKEDFGICGRYLYSLIPFGCGSDNLLLRLDAFRRLQDFREPAVLEAPHIRFLLLYKERIA